ncbi:TonB-dependent copper receptor [Candidatus Albibeggiatoa sp. nov. NOAA]|uniref:TonB-dependent copper receptor n=1 Tax=Candidatus Albibeggiatoa sp. nov. NOAA TaxID=3162724 RepID=UPI0032F51A2A|nr:TonB-dependent copper receptor [Thiotrichaceae bacterium]
MKIIQPLLFLIAPAAIAQDIYLPEISVEDSVLIPNQTEQVVEQSPHFAVDGGDFLRNTTGVSGTRMGGHGIDPIIRGQNQNRLNIILDDAYTFSACPNRMDPASGYANMESYDNITVIKGVQSVIDGHGGSGGTVKFERQAPQFDNKNTRFKASLGYQGNSNAQSIGLDAATGSNQGYIRGMVNYTDADNYEDGDGREVRSGFTTQSAYLGAGYTPDQQTKLEFSAEAIREDDMLFAGAGMDSPKSDNNIFRLSLQQQALKANLYYSDIDHIMDNFSLRQRTAPMKMLTEATSKTYGGRLSYDLDVGQALMTVGLDYQRNERDATRYAGKPTASILKSQQSYMWADTSIQQWGLFGEYVLPIADMDMLTIGLRYDRITANADKANQAAQGGVSPNNLFQKYYGYVADEQDENNIGGLIRYEKNFESSSFFVGLSRTVRTADVTERFMASNNNAGNRRWIGNPEIKPEKHHQLDIGFTLQQSRYQLATSVFYNRVSDFILRDKALGQAGILQQDKASIYRNVDARLYGVELDVQFKLTDALTQTLGIAYTHADNTTDDRPLARIAPLEMTLGLDYQQAQWAVGGLLRLAANQTRFDAQSGLDAGETAGFAVLDLHARYQVAKTVQVQIGLDNVFDKTYAYHVNRANADPFNPEAVRVNEAGRSAWLKLNAQF